MATSDETNFLAAHEERAESVGRYRKIPDDETKPLDRLSHAVKMDAFQIVSLMLVTTFFTVCWACFPGYLKAVNEEGSVYGALVFVSLFSSLFLWILVVAFVVRNAFSSDQSKNFWRWQRCRSQLRAHLRFGFLLGSCGLVLAFARDRNRVLCHLQEPLTALLLPLTFFLGIAGSGPNSGALIFLLSTCFGLFLSVDAQLLDGSYCYGTTDRSERDDQDPWSTETHVLWAIAYVLGVALFAHLHNQFNKFLLVEVKAELSLRMTEILPVLGLIRHFELRGFAPFPDNLSDGEVAHLIRKLKLYQEFGKSVGKAALIQTFALLTTLAFFWTDTLDVLGKSGSISQVGHLMATTFGNHFHSTAVAAYGWPIVVCYSLFLVLLIHSLAFFIRAETLVLAELFAVPLTILGMAVSHGFAVETGFAAVGLVVLTASMVFRYYRKQLSSPEQIGTYSEI